MALWKELPSERTIIDLYEREYDRPLKDEHLPGLLHRIQEFLAGRLELPGSVTPRAGRCVAKCRLSVIVYGEWRYCLGWPLKGRERCRMHGDKPRTGGPRSQFAKSVPAHLAQSFHEGRTPEELLSLRNEIRLIEALQHEALRDMKLGDIEKLVRVGAPAAREVDEGIKTANIPLLRAGARKLAALFDGGTVGRAAAVTRVRQLAQEKKKLVETERRLEEWKYQAMTAEQVMTIVSLLSEIIEEEVEEPGVIARIRARFLEVTTRPSLKVIA